MPPTPVTDARYQRAAGLPLTDEQKHLLREVDRQYHHRQVKVTLTEAEIAEFRGKAEAVGMLLAPWLANLVRQGAQGGLVPRDHALRVEERLVQAQEENDRVQRMWAEQQIRLSDAQALVREYQERIARMALAAAPPGVPA